MQTSNAMRDSAQRGLGLKGAGDDARRGDLEVLTFDLSGEVFALEAILVREVLDQCPETQVPGASGFVDAVINFRGRIVPLADLRMAFGLTRATALAGEGAEGAGEGAAAALLAATARIHDAGASTERDVAALAAQGEGVLALLTRSTDRLDLKTDIGLALAQVLQDLPDEAAAAELCTADIHAPLGAILAQLRASYTMAQERALHDALTSEWGLDTALPPPPAEVASADALDDVLF
jgi:hypothetical protein